MQNFILKESYLEVTLNDINNKDNRKIIIVSKRSTTFEEFSFFNFHRLARASEDLQSTASNSLELHIWKCLYSVPIKLKFTRLSISIIFTTFLTYL